MSTVGSPTADDDDHRPRRLLAIDPATCTGWAAFERCPDSNALLLADWSYYDIDVSSTFQGDWYLDTEKRVFEMIERATDNGAFVVERAFLEDYFFSKRACNGASVNVKYRAVVEMCLRRRSIPYVMIAPASWFSFVVGRMKAGTATSVRKRATREAVRVKYGLSIIPERDNSRMTPYDVFDATAIGIYGALRAYPGLVVLPSRALTAPVEGHQP